MEAVLTEILRILVNYTAIIFCVAGYFCGSLVRNITVIKVIVLLVVLFYVIQFLIFLNNLTVATIPFLVFALIGYWGKEKTLAYLANAFELLREQVERFR